MMIILTLLKPAARWRAVRALLLALSVLLLPGLAAADGGFLSPDEAFQPAVSVRDARTVNLDWTIADGYYLYLERFHFKSLDPGVTLGDPAFPPAEKLFDVNLGHEVGHYRKHVEVALPVTAAPARFRIQITYQGCSDKGLCYPPMEKVVDVSLAGFGGSGKVSLEGASGGGALQSLLGAVTSEAAPGAAPTSPAPAGAHASAAAAASAPGSAASAAAVAEGAVGSAAAVAGGETARIGAALASGRFGLIIPMFLVFGLLLSFTPCVLPMVPILSGIIVGHGEEVSHSRGLALAAVYSIGMALVYTAFGVAAGLLGQGLAAALQNPWVLSAFAALLVLLSLSMFGFYDLQLPSSLQSRLSERSSRLRGGRFAAVFLMGGVSALIVGPCIAAPLAGALLYISQTGNAVVGGVALFSLAAGMSLPLLVVGFGAGALLPRAGVWMDGVKGFFGVLLIATALYMVGPLLPNWAEMLAWAVLLIVSASYLHAFDRLPDGSSGWARLFKGFGVILALAGAVLVVGVAGGGRNILQPLQGVASTSVASAATPHFAPVADLADLDARVAASTQPVMLDFYADWCVSCHELDRLTFPDPRVAARLGHMTLLRADVTRDTAADKAMLKRFSLFGPPGIVFFRDGREVGRVVGAEDADRFLRSMQRAGV